MERQSKDRFFGYCLNFKYRLQRRVAPARPNTNRPRNGRSGGKDTDLPAEVIHSPFQYSGMAGTQAGVRKRKAEIRSLLCVSLPAPFFLRGDLCACLPK